MISPSKRLYAKISQDIISKFASKCHRFAETFFEEGPGTVGDNLDLGRTLLKVKYLNILKLFPTKPIIFS